jgi:hypothetical protein
MSLDAKEISAELNRRMGRTRTASAYSKTTAIDLGDGLSANAQREILEVLLAEPKLFSDVKTKVSPQNFDVPALQRAAEAIFGTLGVKTSATVQDICAAVEEPQIAGLIVELEETGERKGNFEKRLADALAVMEQVERQKEKPAIETSDEKEFMRRTCEQAAKQNRRNMGMV